MATSPASARRYPSDLTDEQWALIAPLLPPHPGVGRTEKHPRRDLFNAILYVLRTGCAWRQLPRDYPPWQTVYWHFRRWNADGTLDFAHDELRAQVRAAEGREADASAGIIDAQSVKGADTVGTATRGFDAGKKVNGRKRHVVVDTLGLVLAVYVTAASVQDRDGGRPVLTRLRYAMRSVVLVFADGGYAGKLIAWAQQVAGVVIEVVRKPADQQGFAVLPRRWVVERTFAWLTRCPASTTTTSAPSSTPKR